MMSSGFVCLFLLGSFAAVSAVLSRQPGPCASNPCQNDGYCHQFYYSDGYFCECTRDYTGFNCEQVHPCARGNPCLNYGSCVGSPDQSEEPFICHCPPGWAGKRCEKRVTYEPCPVERKSCPYPEMPNITDYASCKAVGETMPPEIAACREKDREVFRQVLQSRHCGCRPDGLYELLQSERELDPFTECFYSFRGVSEENPGTCSARGQQCGKLIVKVLIDYDTFEGVQCNENSKAELAEAVRCGEEWTSGQLDLTGCSMYDDVYNKFGTLLSGLASTFCTDCPILTPRLCLQSYKGVNGICRWLADKDKRQECFRETLQDHPACVKFIPKLRWVLDEGWKIQNARIGRYCRKVAEYEKIFIEDWGCAIPGKGKGGPDSWEYGKGKGGPDSWEYSKDKDGPDSWEYGKGKGGPGSWDYGKGKGGPDLWEYGKGKGGPDSWEYGKGKGGPDSWEYGKGRGGPDSWEYGKGKGGPNSLEYGKGKGKGGPDSWDYGKGKGVPDSWDFGKGKDKGGPGSWDYGKDKGKGGPDSWDFGKGKGKGGPDSWDYGKGKGRPDSWEYFKGKGKGGPDSWEYGKGKGNGGPDSLDYGKGKGKGGPDSCDFGKGKGKGKGGPDSWDYGKGKSRPDSWEYGKVKGKGRPDSWEFGKGKGGPESWE